jgi:hypothetical protein
VKISKKSHKESIELIFFDMGGPLSRLFQAGGLDSFFNIKSKEEFEAALV